MIGVRALFARHIEITGSANWDGIPHPSKRRIMPRRKGGTPANGPAHIAIEIHEWRLG